MLQTGENSNEKCRLNLRAVENSSEKKIAVICAQRDANLVFFVGLAHSQPIRDSIKHIFSSKLNGETRKENN